MPPRDEAPGPKRPRPDVVIELEDGATITAPDKEAARLAVAEYEARLEREARRRELWGEHTSGAERMARLCARFPALRGVDGATVGPWDAVHVLAWACGPVSHGERLAALFVLRVWNSGTDWSEQAQLEGLLEDGRTLPRFDMFDAWNVWDREQCAAALTWLAEPFWP